MRLLGRLKNFWYKTLEKNKISVQQTGLSARITGHWTVLTEHCSAIMIWQKVDGRFIDADSELSWDFGKDSRQRNP